MQQTVSVFSFLGLGHIEDYLSGGCIYGILPYNVFAVIPINVTVPLVRTNDMVFVRLILAILGSWRQGFLCRQKPVASERGKEKFTRLGCRQFSQSGRYHHLQFYFICKGYSWYSFSPVYANGTTNEHLSAAVEESFKPLGAQSAATRCQSANEGHTEEALGKYKTTMGLPLFALLKDQTNGNGVLAFPPIFDGLTFEQNNIHLLDGLQF